MTIYTWYLSFISDCNREKILIKWYVATRIFDLEKRTALFGENVLIFCQKIQITDIIKPLVIQMIRSATSVGANYMEASAASSKKDFMNKICICKKEAKETMHWLRMLSVFSKEENKIQLRLLWKEAHELTLIFGAITKSKRI